MRNTALIVIGGSIAVILVIAIGFFMFFRSTYNGFVTKSQAVDGQWAQVETQYQRRFDLTPNLVEATKGIFEQEKAVFTAIADARTRYAGAPSADARAAAAGQVETALARLLVVVENYPEIRSQQNVTQLMDELAGTENRIAVERGRFNTTVLTYNTAIKLFPASIVAGMTGFKERAYFTSTTGADQAPKVQF